MKRYVFKRTLSSLLVVFTSIIINFFIIRLAPGDPIRILAGTDNPNQAMIDALRVHYGLDQSLFQQFIVFMQNLFKGDLGYSYVSNQPVLEIINERIWPTLLLTLTAMIIAVALGIAFGVYCGRKPGSRLDNFISSISYIFDSMPSFWLGMMLILVLAANLNWFPTSGMMNLRNRGVSGIDLVMDIAYHMVLPVTTLVLIQFPYYFRITRTSVVQTLSEDFIMTLRATGMNERLIFNKFVLRNAILPTVTVVGMNFAFLLAGSALIETVFAWPGMGRLLLESINSRDYQVLTGIYLVISVSVAVVMFLIDIFYGLIDPRIKHD